MYIDVTLDGAALVRLVGGATLFEGRVEFFFLGQWGTVCNYNWDLADATVVCRQLGYVRALEVPSSASFGAGSGPSWYNHVRCVGTERSLTECSKSIYHTGNACPHSRDAAVKCSSKFYNIDYAYIVILTFVKENTSFSPENSVWCICHSRFSGATLVMMLNSIA